MSAKVIDLPRYSAMGGDLAIIDHLLARGEIVPAQLPSASSWSPEKKLAAAIFTSALLSIRDHSQSRSRRRRREAREDLDWVASNESSWPYSFLRMCELFGLEPTWVRASVRSWVDHPGEHEGRRFSTHRHAA